MVVQEIKVEKATKAVWTVLYLQARQSLSEIFTGSVSTGFTEFPSLPNF